MSRKLGNFREEKKLRYPNKKEIDCCFENLISEIEKMNPKIVFLLGEKVYSSVGKKLNLKFEKWSDFEYHYTEFNKTYFIPIIDWSDETGKRNGNVKEVNTIQFY